MDGFTSSPYPLYYFYDITMMLLGMPQSSTTIGNNIATDIHYDITMMLLGMPQSSTTIGNNIARDIHYDITMDNEIAICTQHGITMDNDIPMNFFCYVLLCQIMILLFHSLHSLKLYT